MKKSTKRKAKQKQITISNKTDGGKSCSKCRNLRTPNGSVICLKDREFNARVCHDFDDVSVNRAAIFGGTTGMILGGAERG